MKSLQLPKARLKLLKAELNLLRLEFRNNPKEFNVFVFSIRVIGYEAKIKALERDILIGKQLEKQAKKNQKNEL